MQTLDNSQLRFAEAKGNRVRLLAPAGCGKTLSLLYRCRHLAATAPSQRPRFLIVTFTVAARAELTARLNEDPAFKDIRDLVVATTLNSFGYTRIKNQVSHHRLISTKEEFHFTMLNQLRPVWTKHESVSAAIEGKRKHSLPRQFMGLIDSFKSLGFDHVRHTNQEKFFDRMTELRAQRLGPKIQKLIDDLTKAEVIDVKRTKQGEEVARASDRKLYSTFFQFWREATQLLFDSATFTLEDQKYYAYIDERQKVEEGKFLSGAAAFDHVLVDEFQDINPLDLLLIKYIVERSRATLTVAGDDDQAIFEWRGATPAYILDPGRNMGGTFDTFVLENNYRSPKNIVDMSQTLIRHNTVRVDKDVRAQSPVEAEVELRKCDGLTTCLEFVYNIVQETVSGRKSPAQIAIVGRKRSQIIPYQVFLASKNVSFCAAEDLQIFLSKAFERLLELIAIKNRAHQIQMRTEVVADTLKLCDLVKRFPLSKADKDSLQRYLNEARPKSVHEAAIQLAEYKGPLKSMKSGQAISRAMSDSLLAYLDAHDVTDALLAMGANFEGLQIDLGKAEDDIFYTDPPFYQLAEFAERYGDDYPQFLDDIQTAKDQLLHLPPYEEDGKPAAEDELWKRPVQLMTALRAKGKEFDTVILLDVNDGIWPSKNARTLEEREAERRVFYVAFTRAKRRVVMLIALRFGNRPGIVSPYVEELGLSLA